MPRYLELTLRDPVIVRDGRPFSLGQRMRSLDWPYPSVLAGSLRSLLGKQREGGTFTEDTVRELKAVEVAGPLPARRGVLYFPPPKDMVVRGNDGSRTPFVLRPQGVGEGEEEGVDFPVKGLQPVLPTRTPEREFKPAPTPAFWSLGKMQEWLTMVDPPEGWEATPAPGKGGCGYLDAPKQDDRTHVKIEPETGAHDEGMLFRTVGLALDREVTLSARVEAVIGFGRALTDLSGLHPFGGERRLVHWHSTPDTPQGWSCPTAVVKALTGACHLRMVLATPALFDGGWKPGWLGDGLTGRPPVEGAPELTLVGVCIDRWRPISGWSLERGKVGPKAIKRLVPAGGVYFCTTTDPLAADTVRRMWLQSVCDCGQDRRDGFGLAVWGIWEPTKGEE